MKNPMNAGTQVQLNVSAFGAKGDGQTDDTAAFVAALEAAAAVKGIVCVPEGTFLISGIKLPPHTGLVGNATWAYRSLGGSILKLHKPGPDTKGLIDITGACGATINGLSLLGDRASTAVPANLPTPPAPIHGIHMGPLEGKKEEDAPRIERCHISQFTGNGIHLDPVWCFSIRSCEVIFNQGHGLHVGGWDGFILDNWFSGNGGAGYSATGLNASVTMTGNRIEWNAGGGIRILGGGHYNITGNYVDRAGGPGITIGARGAASPSTCITLTGNVIYRSGKPDWTSKTDEFESCHVRIEDSRGIVFTGNSMCVGQDDGGGVNSPSYGIVLHNLKNCVVQSNSLHIGALKQIVLDRGGHGEGVVIKDNVGSLLPNPDKSIWEPGQRE